MEILIFECMRNLFKAIVDTYLETLFLKPLNCFEYGCTEESLCKKNKTNCNEKEFKEIKKLFEEHPEIPKSWFYGAEKVLLFDDVKKFYKDCDCLADVRAKIKVEIKEKSRNTMEINGKVKKKRYLYKSYRKADGELLFTAKSINEMAEKMDASAEVIRNALKGKSRYLKDFEIKRELITKWTLIET